MTSRRRMMMQQVASAEYELVYDPACGLLPTKCGWGKDLKPWDNVSIYGKESLENGWLKVEPNHTYENMWYYPLEQSYECNKSISVEFTMISQITIPTVSICNGDKYAQANISRYQNLLTNGLRMQVQRHHGEKPQAETETQFVKSAVEYADINTFTIEIINDIAKYYFNGDLMYTQENLYSLPHTNTRLSIERPTAIGFLFDGGAYIRKMTYREW